MASVLNRLGACALRGTYRVRPRRSHLPPNLSARLFHQSCRRRKESSSRPPTPVTIEITDHKQSRPEHGPLIDDTDTATVTHTDVEINRRGLMDGAQIKDANDPQIQALEDLESSQDNDEAPIATPEQKALLEQYLSDPPAEYAEAIAKYKAEMKQLEGEFARDIGIDDEFIEAPGADQTSGKRFRGGFLSMGEDDEEEEGGDEPFEGDDITSLAHGDLEQHRELREYSRIAAWEMPLLSSMFLHSSCYPLYPVTEHVLELSKPFEPPEDAPLRFRYTSYMGENHPAENKVVLEFCTADLPLSPKERIKMIKLLGVRYNPQQDLVKMSCEMFSTIAQNKRYLGDLVDTLMATAKGEGSMEGANDSFEDVPVDFRHVRWRSKPEFPQKWKLTSEKRQILAKRREQSTLEERQRAAEGCLVDGNSIVEAALKTPLFPSRESNSLRTMQFANQSTRQRI